MKRLAVVHVQMEPGDGVFFHANLLHRSDQNRSDHPRWSMICVYNAARNDPCMESHQPRSTRGVKVPDAKIKEYGNARFAPETAAQWLAPDQDHSATSLGQQALSSPYGPALAVKPPVAQQVGGREHPRGTGPRNQCPEEREPVLTGR